MADPQGIITFSGIESPDSGSFSFGHGIQPARCLLRILPQKTKIPEFGKLTLSFGSTLITFPDCKVVLPSSEFTEQGQTISLTIFDRRWKWKYGWISGRYNVRKPNGLIETETEQSPRDLAKLCLEAMGEEKYKLDKMPDDARPEINWDFANPAQELADLCDSLGCRVVLHLDNTVSIEIKGQGKPLPDNGLQMDISNAIDAGLRPSEIMFVAGPTRWQTRFDLEPVGLDIDGQIKLLDQLSYKPAAGWATSFPPQFIDVLKEHGLPAQQCAQQSVYRWYRIKSTTPYDPEQQWHFAEIDVEVTKLDQILPIQGELIDSYVDESKLHKPVPAIVRGTFIKPDMLQPQLNVTDRTRYHGSFSVQSDTGIVEFSDPVVLLRDKQILPAELTIECVHGIRDPDTRQFVRHTKTQTLPGENAKTEPELLTVDEAYRSIIQRYDDTGNPDEIETNDEDLEKIATQMLKEKLEDYKQPESYDINYIGLLAIEPDGAIQQVVWTTGADGATTRASLNNEFDMDTPSYDERRRKDKADKTERNAKKILMTLLRK